MYVFNRITVNPQLPKRIGRITEIANNLWWSWNTEFLRLFKKIDKDLWEKCDKNPVKFLKSVDQEKLEDASKDLSFVREYDKIVEKYPKVSDAAFEILDYTDKNPMATKKDLQEFVKPIVKELGETMDITI